MLPSQYVFVGKKVERNAMKYLFQNLHDQYYRRMGEKGLEMSERLQALAMEKAAILAGD